MNNQTTKIDPINGDDEADSKLNNALRLLWCAKEDSNLHVLGTLAPEASASTIPPLAHVRV